MRMTIGELDALMDDVLSSGITPEGLMLALERAVDRRDGSFMGMIDDSGFILVPILKPSQEVLDAVSSQ